MDQTIIRKATVNDLEELYHFEQGVIEAERPYDPTLKNGLIHYYDLKEMIKASHIEVLVAEVENKIIGSGYARIEKAKPYLKHNNHAYLGFMYVCPEHRGKGINKKIIEALKNWALSKNVKELRLDVYFNNISAIKAYEKIGFSKHMIEMRFNLEE
jgi:GNAT superfamily N-acetyltransferase